MKTWICAIYGGGAPIYMVSAENEKRAWQLIKREIIIKYDGRVYLTTKDCTGLCEVPEWNINREQISDICELYAHNGVLKNGSFEGFR